MKLFKISQERKKVCIKMLIYNPRVWSESQWKYSFMKLGSYPTDQVRYATDFKTVEKAQAWIDSKGVELMGSLQC